jgi:hypothetical protein
MQTVALTFDDAPDPVNTAVAWAKPDAFWISAAFNNLFFFGTEPLRNDVKPTHVT